MANTWLDVAEEVSSLLLLLLLLLLLFTMSGVQVVMIGTSAGAVGTEYNCDLLAEEVAKVGSWL